jgi:putative ABC transport system substrate-binding protein
MMRRRFIAGVTFAVLGAIAPAWAQAPAPPVVGFLNSASPSAATQLVASFHNGLAESGYTEGRNVTVDYRWANGQYNLLPGMASELVQRRVAVIAATGGLVSARAAMAATTSIPVLFVSGFDPVQLGLVKSLNRPGGNATGVSVYTTELVSKRLQLIRDMLPQARTIALLVNPQTVVAEIEIKELAALRHLGVEFRVLRAANDAEVEAVFASSAEQKIGAILVSADPFFTSRRHQLSALAARHGIPAAYPWREYSDVGGLMSYGPSITDAYRQIGVYAGMILKGSRPEDLPVRLPAKFDFVINMQAARALGITVPASILTLANEVIE